MPSAHPTHHPDDYRVIDKVAFYRAVKDGSLLVSGDNVTVSHALAELSRCREAHVTAILGGSNSGAFISGPTDSVLPVLVALLSHADPGVSGE